MPIKRINNIAGIKYGRLLALEPTQKKNGHNTVWVFQCDCGNIVEFPRNAVVSGNTNSQYTVTGTNVFAQT